MPLINVFYKLGHKKKNMILIIERNPNPVLEHSSRSPKVIVSWFPWQYYFNTFKVALCKFFANNLFGLPRNAISVCFGLDDKDRLFKNQYLYIKKNYLDIESYR